MRVQLPSFLAGVLRCCSEEVDSIEYWTRREAELKEVRGPLLRVQLLKSVAAESASAPRLRACAGPRRSR
jgi:hypothetical protein